MNSPLYQGKNTDIYLDFRYKCCILYWENAHLLTTPQRFLVTKSFFLHLSGSDISSYRCYFSDIGFHILISNIEKKSGEKILPYGKLYGWIFGYHNNQVTKKPTLLKWVVRTIKHKTNYLI